MYAFFPLKEKVVLLWHLSPWKPALQVQLALGKKKKKMYCRDAIFGEMKTRQI